MTVKKHRHEFTALWWHLGIYGPQNVHVHSCFDQDCDRVVVGPGRDCDGDRSTHHRETLGTGKDPMTWFPRRRSGWGAGMTTIHCLTHQCTAENFIARCYWALWANALEKCDLREMELIPVEVEGQEDLFTNLRGTW